MDLKFTQQIEKISHLVSVQSASALFPNLDEDWTPPSAFGIVVKDLGPAAVRAVQPRSTGEERLLSDWLDHWKELHSHFYPLGVNTPVESLFDFHSRSSAVLASKRERCVSIAIEMPWADPSVKSIKTTSIDPLARRKYLARFNFPALLELVQQYCDVCRKVLTDESFRGPEAYNLVAAVEIFSRDAFSMLAEEARKLLERKWIRYSETTSGEVQGINLMQDPAWDDLRMALSYQIISIRSLINSVWRLQKEDKMLDFIVNTGLLLVTLISEEIANSSTRKKSEAPMKWDSKALLWQALSSRLKTIPFIIGGEEPGCADVLLSLMGASGAIAVHYGGKRHFSLISRWQGLLSYWNSLARSKGPDVLAQWYQRLKDSRAGTISKDFVLLYDLEILFYSCLDDLSPFYITALKNKNRGLNPIPDELIKLFPPFSFDEVSFFCHFQINPSVKALVAESS